MDDDLRLLMDTREGFARVEARLDEVLNRLEELDAMSDRLDKAESDIAWVRAWSAGAAAAAVGLFGAITWIATKMPAIMSAVAR